MGKMREQSKENLPTMRGSCSSGRAATGATSSIWRRRWRRRWGAGRRRGPRWSTFWEGARRTWWAVVFSCAEPSLWPERWFLMLLKEKEFVHFFGFWSQGHRHWMKLMHQMESFHKSFKVVGSLKTLRWPTWGRRWLVDEELRGWREASQKRRRWGRGWEELALPAAMEVITTPWQWFAQLRRSQLLIYFF